MLRHCLVVTLLAVSPMIAAPAQAQDRDTLYQVSTLGALQQGVFQSALSVKELKAHGDFGLGTYEGLNGEMVVDAGTVFQVPFSGAARVARAGQKTPFAVVTFFDADRRFRVSRQVDVPGLGSAIDRRLPSLNDFYAVKVTGIFASVQTRSVKKQSLPYPPLSTAVAGQRTFEFTDITGTLVGIRSPQYVGSMNVPGYHWHFIADNGKTGGHVLALSASGLKVAVDRTRKWHVELPDESAFGNADLR